MTHWMITKNTRRKALPFSGDSRHETSPSNCRIIYEVNHLNESSPVHAGEYSNGIRWARLSLRWRPAQLGRPSFFFRSSSLFFYSFFFLFLLISLFPTPLTLQEDPLVPFPSKGPRCFPFDFPSANSVSIFLSPDDNRQP